MAEIDLFLKAVIWKYLIKCTGVNIYSILGTLRVQSCEDQ